MQHLRALLLCCLMAVQSLDAERKKLTPGKLRARPSLSPPPPQQDNNGAHIVETMTMTPPPPPTASAALTPCPCDAKAGCSCVQFYLCMRGTITESGFGILRKRAPASSCPVNTQVCCPLPSLSASGHEEPITAPEVHYPEACGTRRQRPAGAKTSWHAASSTYFGEFPWTVMIQGQGGDPLCSGALVHANIVVTAAHCVDQINVKHLKVIAGDWDYLSTAEPLARLERLVRLKMVHDDYDDVTLAHDVALLVLEKPLPASGNVHVVCVPSHGGSFSSSFLNGRCLSTGWGKDEYSPDESRITTMKMTTWTTVQTSESTCEDLVRGTKLEEFYGPGRGQICARAKPQGQVCKNDVGSPLVCPDQNDPERHVLVGLAYGRIQCGEKNNKELFVSVPDHREWIMKAISDALSGRWTDLNLRK